MIILCEKVVNYCAFHPASIKAGNDFVNLRCMEQNFITSRVLNLACNGDNYPQGVSYPVIIRAG